MSQQIYQFASAIEHLASPPRGYLHLRKKTIEAYGGLANIVSLRTMSRLTTTHVLQSARHLRRV